jgi:competence protein ComEC
MTKSRIFLYSCLFFILGIGLGSFFAISSFYIYTGLLVAIIVLVLGWQKPLFKILGIGGIFLFLGIFYYEFSLPKINENYLAFYNGETAKFVGVVVLEPDVRENNTKLTIESKELTVNSEQKHVKGRVLVKTGLYPEYNYGDRLEINCELNRPEKINDFDYEKYLARYDIYSLCFNPEIKKMGEDQGNIVIKYLFVFKNYFIGTINRILPEPQASFLGGLLVGARRSISEDLMQNFNRTGLTHIIAISGYNITIIAAILLSLFQGIGLGRKRSFWLVIAGILFFVVITGASSSVIRAAIMGILVLLAKQVGRVSRVANALVLAAILMLLFNPKILVFDAGFQLSFLATIGLVYLSPILEKYFASWPEVYGLKNSLVTTLSAIILTTPLILYQFGRLSLVAPLANILVLPLIPWAMALGFVAAALGLLWWRLGWVFGWLVWLVLSYIILVVETLGKLNWSAVEIKGLPSWLMIIIYGIIGAWIWRNNRPLTLSH